MKILVLNFILISGTMLWCSASFSQVYNYAPINYQDVETNPSRLASNLDMNNRVQLIHLNNFSSSNRFSFTSLRLTKYFESAFTGFGLALSNTSMKDDVTYNTVAICSGYRNVLFHSVYLKAGVAYKITDANHPQHFDYYTFSAPERVQGAKSAEHLVNLSLSFSSNADWLYASFFFLNIDLPWGDSDAILFPKYYGANFGDLVHLFDNSRSWDVSYSIFRKFYDANEPLLLNHYIDPAYNLWITRRSGVTFSIRTGYLENKFLHFIPGIKYYRENFGLTLSYGFHRDKTNFDPAYYSTSQINIIFYL